MDDSRELAARRARLAAIERELARLRATHDLAMSAFKFDEASAVQRRIEPLDDERRSLAARLPAPMPAAGPDTGVVPVLARPRPARRRRMG